MNRCFKKPVVVTKRGGAKGGAAVVTDEGKAVLALYRRMEAASLRAARSGRKELTKYLR